MKKLVLCFFLVVSVFMNVLGTGTFAAPSMAGISAKAAILIDAQTGRIICSKNEREVLPMASTTKIMTTLLMLESGNLDEEFVVDSNAVKVEGSSMGLKEGDIVTKRALCYGMMLPSGNDAANCTAIKLAENYNDFADMMNRRASEIGMKSTHFVTPSGLHDPKHYSTAYDMAMLTREAMKNDDFREICSTTSAKLKYGNPPYDRWLSNSNRLLNMYPGCIGVKTGFTDEAGRCLVSAVEKDGITLICVTLKASDDWNDHIEMYDYGFSVVSKYELLYDNNINQDIVGGNADSIRLIPSEIPACTALNKKLPDYYYEVVKKSFVYAPVKEGEVVGEINFYSDGELLESVDLLAGSNVEAVIDKPDKSLYNRIIDFLKQYL